jgi:hypothetical protein
MSKQTPRIEQIISSISGDITKDEFYKIMNENVPSIQYQKPGNPAAMSSYSSYNKSSAPIYVIPSAE